MSARTVDVFQASDLMELLAAEPDLLAVADAIALTQEPAQTRRLGRRSVLFAAAVVLVVALASPAFGVVQLVVDFFSSPPAPHATIVSFGDVEAGAPDLMDPHVAPGEARRVAQFQISDGSTVSLSVVPTKSGGFCEEFSGFAETCDAARQVPIDLGFAAKRLPGGPAIIFGSVLSPVAVRVEVTLSDGQTVQVPLTRVSAPINAGFYFLQIDPSQGPISGRALDEAGNVVASGQVSGSPQVLPDRVHGQTLGGHS